MTEEQKALLAQKKGKDARPILEELSKDTRSQYGAESDYLLSQFLYDSGDKEGAEKVRLAGKDGYGLEGAMIHKKDGK